ncbi:MAG: ABC transporter substrate-binding protein [Dehalococcoidia bacterium]|nr:ABC transporter substrate-binding protein [Dehalococcoidia bacterium]
MHPPTRRPISPLTRRRFLSGIGSAGLAAGFLAACGDDGDGRVATPVDTATAGGTATTATASAAAPSATATEAATLPFVDYAGREVQIPTHPTAISALWRPTLSSLTLLGFPVTSATGDEAAPRYGLAQYLPADFDFDALTIVGSNREPDFEKVAAASPDLIAGADVSGLTDIYDQLAPIAPTALFPWSGTGAWRTHLEKVASALAVDERAVEVVADYQARAERARAAIGDVGSLSVSLVRIQSAEELRLETPLGFPGSILQDIGFGRPEAQVTPEEADRDFISISLERIRDCDGDVIFVMVSPSKDDAWRSIESNALWQGLSAVQAGRVLVFDYDWWGASNYYGAYRILDDIEAHAEGIA